jgi:hypothetical protein
METKIITIRPIAGRPGEHIAYIKDRFLGATFAVTFCDSITGAVTLTKFTKLIEQLYSGCPVETHLSSVQCRFKSAALLDLMTEREESHDNTRSMCAVDG